MSTTTVRKLRFPMLIGGGIIAAGFLIYFSNGYLNSQKTQGAIGQRDVYRDGEVKAADVAATPGVAPVAMTALLQTKEFQSLANNQAFTALLSDSSFREMTQSQAFLALMHDQTFVQMVAALNSRMSSESHKKMSSESHQQASAESNSASMIAAMQAEMSAASSVNSQSRSSQDALQQLANNESFSRVLHNATFRSLAADKAFVGLVSSASFEKAMANSSASLLHQ